MEQELDLYALWQVIAKRWKLIVLIPLVAGLISFFYSTYMVTPLYTASTTLIVIRRADPAELYWQDLQLSRELVGTYREIMHSRRVQEQVIVNQSLPYDAGVLREKIDVQAVRDTEVFTVSITDADPRQARDIANEMALVFQEQVVEIMEVQNVSVIDEAVTPVGPVSPRIDLNVAVAFVVGLMGAFGLAFLLEYLDRTIKDPEEAHRLLEIPVIGVIPKVDGDRLFAWSNPRSPAAEAFHSLRTNLQYSVFAWSKTQPSEDLGALRDNFHYSSMEGPVKSILVAGANPACGKSTVTANLAVTLARSGSSVLVVDGDLRRPYLHQFFKVENDPGLSTLIFNKDLALEATVQKSEVENLSVLASGFVPPYPAEMLSSKRMEKLAETLAKNYDYVIYDSPPVMAVTDAALLSRLVDGTLVVFDYGKVSREEAAGALEHFKKVQANVIGLVINNMPQSRSYYNGYRYYYGEKDKQQARRGYRKSKAR